MDNETAQGPKPIDRGECGGAYGVTVEATGFSHAPVIAGADEVEFCGSLPEEPESLIANIDCTAPDSFRHERVFVLYPSQDARRGAEVEEAATASGDDALAQFEDVFDAIAVIVVGVSKPPGGERKTYACIHIP